MRRFLRSRAVLPGLALVTLWGVVALTGRVQRAPQLLPDRLDDRAFWSMVTEMSEPGGYFHSDNFVSNEAAYQYVIPSLERRISPGGVYLGVGPDQNFTYLVAFRPRIAFVIDIRRQNMLQHLMFKALLELSEDRSQFLSLLFARQRPVGLDRDAPAPLLLERYALVAPDSALYRRTLASIVETLVGRHAFGLDRDDIAAIEYVYGAFFTSGPHLTYTFGQGRHGFSTAGMPTYGHLMVETDGHGVLRSYLASEEHFARLKDLQARNLVVPLVGDFAGDKALRAVGTWLGRHRASVSLFYTSNVEQYLFQQGDSWRRFYENVSRLPRTDTSTFIRSVANRRMVAAQNPNSRSVQLIASMNQVVEEVRSGRLTSYFDLVRLSRQP
jgi:hypothetical protein